MRIGHGFDAHRFGQRSDNKNDHIVIAGVRIDYDQGLIAHSDGDVAIHALCDALLGAAALGDIGKLFPDSDKQYADVDSRELLRAVVSRLQEKDLLTHNIDMTIVAQTPKMAPHIARMRENLAADLGIGIEQVNVKATTTEGMGFTGRAEGISTHAVVLLEERAND